MMNFKKGSKVEVMNKKEVPTSWRVAEIISGNGHTYRVRYESYSMAKNDAVLERVSRKDSEKFTNCNQTLSFQVPQLNAKINKRRGDCLPIQNDAGLPETRKRVSPLCSSLLDPYAGKAKKHRANETEQRSQIVPARLLEKGHNWRHESCFHRSKDDSELPFSRQ